MTSELNSTVPAVGIKGGRAIARWIWAPVVAILLLSGCASTSFMVGVREPDLTRIQPGDPRSRVERVLDKRLWRPGSADGLTYDIYQYEAGRPAEPLWGAISLGFASITLGMTELQVADAKKLQPVKQVAVAYDEQDRLRFVSQPWLVPTGRVGACRRMRTLLPTDSGVPSTAHPSPMVRPDGSASEVATLKWRSYIHVTIDGRKLEGRVVELPPGRHVVNYGAALGGSVMYGAMSLPYNHTAEVELLPGRRYRLKDKRYYGWPRERADLFWIEDVDSGETLHCAWPTPR